MNSGAPAPHEFEVSIFGRGTGECIVVHLGDGRWAVVDSFCYGRGEHRRPVALAYLKRLGIEPEGSISLVVATHWDDDHINGISEVVENSRPDVDVWVSLCLDSEDLEAWAMLIDEQAPEDGFSSGTSEYLRLLELVPEDRFGWAQENLPLTPTGSRTEVRALSPSRPSVRDGLQAVGVNLWDLSAKARGPAPNPSSVALLLTAGQRSVLLGGDLPTGPANRGWEGVLKLRGVPRATVFKVPHHGSSTSVHPRVDRKLIRRDAVRAVTRFNGGRSPLPSKPDLMRMAGLPGLGWVAGRPGPKAFESDPELRAVIDRSTVGGLTEAEGPIGQVRVRWSLDDPTKAASVETSGWVLDAQAAARRARLRDSRLEGPRLVRESTFALSWSTRAECRGLWR